MAEALLRDFSLCSQLQVNFSMGHHSTESSGQTKNANRKQVSPRSYAINLNWNEIHLYIIIHSAGSTFLVPASSHTQDYGVVPVLLLVLALAVYYY